IYDKGLYLQAYQQAETISPLPRWTGTRARILAGRLAGNLGGPRLGEWHFIRAWRTDRSDPEASWFYGRYLLDAHGPWKALQFVKSQGTFPEASIEIRSYWLSLHAMVYGRVRDFAAAEKWLAQAESLGWDHPWIRLERAALCSLEDRHEEAMAAAQTALKVRPWYRPAVQWLAHFHVQKEQDEEAVKLLSEAARRMESSAIWSQLANLQMELGRYEEASRSLEEFARLAPLLDKGMAEWLAARRSDAAYYCGDIEQSREEAKKVKGRFFEAQVKRLENPPADGKRVCLPVGFVRQHFQTCAPATLAAICRFWEMPGDHLEMAAAITYAGTPNHSERQWAMDSSWFTREFTVTWDSAVAVLDQGIPFTLTTPEVSSSHLQAVIGYDSIRGTLIIRDPGERHQSEFLAEGLAERYAASGPRGMALLPLKDKEKLASLNLPDSDLYDHMYQLEKALETHDRAKAEQVCRELEAKAGKHRLAYLARRTLAVYDSDTPSILAVTEKQLELFPEDLRWQLSKVNCLRTMARRDEYLALLKKLSEQKISDPACWQQYAQELADDAREHPRALHLLRRSLRYNPGDARTFHCLARIHWDRRQFPEAFDLYRIAACLEETDEHLARSYFQAASTLGKTEEALEFLEQRFERFGSKSGQPARTLSWAYFQLERTREGFEVLEKALSRRPDDADLLLYAIDQRIQFGRFTQARELLIQAKGHSQKTAWLRSTANLAAAQGDLEIARKVWAKVLEVEPLGDDAHAAYARLLAETKGRAAALKHLHKTCDRFPYNFQLKELLVEWLHEDGPEAVEPVVRKLIDIHPANAWARRELAL
ncbi:MAG TPA: C39 family peptidase, partial [Acidocella sp.]|nr:C39 family peptidase [Acidocella sp.]